jgi:hypothetical protein
MANYIVKNGNLELFWGINFNKLKFKCYNSIKGLSLGAKKKIVGNEIVQIHALNSFKELSSSKWVFTC